MWGCVPCPEDPFCPCVPPPQALLSHRTREVTVSLRATGLVLKTLPASDTEGEELGKQGSWGRRRKEDGPGNGLAKSNLVYQLSKDTLKFKEGYFE